MPGRPHRCLTNALSSALLTAVALLLIAGCQPLIRPPTEEPPVVAASPGAPGMDDPLYPGLGNGGYDVHHYALDLVANPATARITGTTTIQAQAVQNLSAFNLDFRGLKVQAVQVNGEAAGHRRQGSELVIEPAAPLPAGSVFTTVVDYAGFPVPVRDPAAPMRVGWQRQPGGAFVASEPSGAMSWYPNNNHPADKATYTLRITVPDTHQVAANGLLADVLPSPGTNTFVWQMDQPMASYLTTVHIGVYDVVSTTMPSGVIIRNYFPPATSTTVRAGFDETPAMIEFMERLVAPYPFEAYGVALLTMPTSWALETQTLSTYGARGAWSQEVVIHELVHSWFGNSVSPATWRDVWLNEGFATYFSALWLDHTGERPLAEYMPNLYQLLATHEVGPPALVPANNLFGDETYLRGAYALHTLRQRVGDDRFFAIIREYYTRYAGGHAATADFMSVVYELGGSDAAALLDAWLYDEVVPPAAEGDD